MAPPRSSTKKPYGRLPTDVILPQADVDEDLASFYVFRDDIVMFPISYSIPKDRILSELPKKTQLAMNDSMKSFQFKNYKFGPHQEEEYHRHIQEHYFGDTRRKGGFDCLRHYELMANGCIPIFHDLEHLPKSILRTLPRALLTEAKALYTTLGEAEEKISTESTARYILRTLNVDESDARVLFLPCSPFDNFPSYLTASVFHGMVSLLGDRVIDVPEYTYAYRYDNGGDIEEDIRIRANIWGQGFTLGFKLDQRPYLNRANLSQRIRQREFDLIIFGRMSPYEPCNFYAPFGDRAHAVPEYYMDVSRFYPKERVALLYGDDSGIDDAVIRTQLYRMGTMNTGLGIVFLREMLPFVSEGAPGETLRPVDGRVLQPGCFYQEWLTFFELWRSSACDVCLSSCVVEGNCEAVEKLKQSLSYELLPPEDEVIHQQFCWAGFVLKAAALVQYYQPDACLDDLHCRIFCEISRDRYTRLLQNAPSNGFFRETGVTPQEVLLLLSQGCASGRLALTLPAELPGQEILFLSDRPWSSPLMGEWQARLWLAQGFRLHYTGSSAEEVPVRLQSAYEQKHLILATKTDCRSLRAFNSSVAWALFGDSAQDTRGHHALPCLLEGFQPQHVSLERGSAHAVALLLAAGFCRFKVTRWLLRSLGSLFGESATDVQHGLHWQNATALLSDAPVLLSGAMVQTDSGRPESDSEGTSDAEDEDKAYVRVSRAELMRGHRPVVVSEVPVYVALEDREGRRFEDKGSCPHVRYRWMRGPVIEPCFFHPHKMSQIRDVAKTYNCYCSRECFLRGWHHLPQHLWSKKPDSDTTEEFLAEWTQVASTRTYCPSQSDINRPLRMDIIPLTKDGRECEKGMMSITTGTVIPTPKEARMRQMISNGGQFNAEWLSKQFKVMNWNILADLYATENVYPYCEKWALSWNWRKHLIIKELKSMAADIITLQEVQKDAYDEWFKPTLSEAGYEGIFQAKKRDPIFHRGKYTTEGCATFFKVTRFKRLDKAIFDYDRLSREELRQCSTDPEIEAKAVHRVNRGNIALAVILEDKLQKKSSHSGHILCVVNTHILCDPAAADVKLFQAHLLLKAIHGTTAGRVPILVCGDFNSTPDSAVYEYFRRGTVRQEHEDLKKDPCGLMRLLNLRSGACMATAYETCTGKEATFTNYTEDFKGTLDYIWFSPENLSVLAISQVDDESQLSQESALPSSTRPSDHVSLVATFMFHDEPEQVNRRMMIPPHAAHSAHQMGHYHVQHGTAPQGDGMYAMGAMYPQQYL
ncbi:Carbon catabolite repressor protein 4 homolog 1 (CCR4 homolog 1) [Durusdinium trenchii]|uniref:Carbon catabolite repressor protein 4 homolog 1 (CCR4 homolog 1) n=1 Tax=Durusdinium trenchii TaxID=1381693 RepID=A0ABP0R1A6_9DINO